MTHRDGLPRFSARSVWRGDAGHREARATLSESLGKPPFRSSMRPVRRASESLDDAPHRLRLPSYPTGRMDDPYGSLSSLLGINQQLGWGSASIFSILARTVKSP
jgi:hypothetical protein